MHTCVSVHISHLSFPGRSLGRSELIITPLKSGRGVCEIGPTPWIVLREMKRQGRDVTAVEPGYASGYKGV